MPVGFRRTAGILSTPLPALAVGIALRAAYWIPASHQPWFNFPGMDPEFYLHWADDILAGNASAYLPFPRGPLYPYLLALLRGGFGEGWLVPRLFNLLCDLATIFIVFLTANRVAGLPAAHLASLLWAACGAGVYFSGELLATSLETALFAFTVFALSSFSPASVMRSGLSGLALGVLSLSRPNTLLLIPLTMLHLYRASRGAPSRPRTLSAPILHLVAAILPLTPAAAANWSAGAVVPVSLQGGVNFYIGNARGADGWSSSLPGVGAAWTEDDARALAESAAGRPLSPAEVSSELWLLGWREIAAAPAEWLSLMARKVLLLISIREIGNNRPLSLATEAAPFMGILFGVSLGVMFPLAVVGVWGRRDSETVRVTAATAALYGLTLLPFFITARYRLPLVPPTAVLAATGAMVLGGRLRRREIVPAGVIALGAALASAVPWALSDYDESAQAQFVAGNAYLRAGKPAQALARWSRAARLAPEYPDLALNTGVAFLQLGDTTAAESAFRRELNLQPHRGAAWNNLGVIIESRGDWAGAADAYERARRDPQSRIDATANLARLLTREGDRKAERGDFAAARSDYRRALDLKPDDPTLLVREALACASLGEREDAVRAAQRALAVRPGYEPAERLLQALRVKR